MFELVVLLARRERSKELEILVLRHELSILRRQVRRPQFAPRDRLLLAALSRVLPRCCWHAFPVTPGTLLRWHRQLVARHWTYAQSRLGRPPVDRSVRELILRLARENSSWGYVRIIGELRKLGIDVSVTLVRNVLRNAGIPPAAAAWPAGLALVPAPARRGERARLRLICGGLIVSRRGCDLRSSSAPSVGCGEAVVRTARAPRLILVRGVFAPAT